MPGNGGNRAFSWSAPSASDSPSASSPSTRRTVIAAVLGVGLFTGAAYWLTGPMHGLSGLGGGGVHAETVVESRSDNEVTLTVVRGPGIGGRCRRRAQPSPRGEVCRCRAAAYQCPKQVNLLLLGG